MCSNKRNGTDTEVATDEPVSCQMGEKVGDEIIKETERTWKMAIVCSDLIVPKFSDDILEELREAIIDAILACIDTEDGRMPLFEKFEHCYKRNCIQVTCINEYSKQWLIDEVKKLSPFRGMSLVVVDEKDVPEFRQFHVYVPEINRRTVYDILKLIKKTAPALKTELWKIIKTKSIDDCITAARFQITDPSSVQLVEELNYEVRVGMGKAYFWDCTNNKGHPQAEVSRKYHLTLL